ncbi:MAG: hypothetical protein GEU81_14865, partial [Nitriliruptorales bacterium]|nr:hypothetical protein [Nitriliruptorales bacterium]
MIAALSAALVFALAAPTVASAQIADPTGLTCDALDSVEGVEAVLNAPNASDELSKLLSTCEYDGGSGDGGYGDGHDKKECDKKDHGKKDHGKKERHGKKHHDKKKDCKDEDNGGNG